jgi:hypothetical protein
MCAVARELGARDREESRASNGSPSTQCLLAGYAMRPLGSGAVIGPTPEIGQLGPVAAARRGVAGPLGGSTQQTHRARPRCSGATVSLRRRISGGGRSKWGQPMARG